MAVEPKISPENLLPWSGMEDWENGASAAPTEHNLTAGSIARESSTIKEGTYSAAVTRSGSNVQLNYDLPDYADYVGRKITFGMWVYATVASRGRISISDGVGSNTSSYHTGGSSWERLTVTYDVDQSATRIRFTCEVNTGNTTVYFDGGKGFEGDSDQTVFSDISGVVISQMIPVNRFKGQTFNPARREGSRIPRMLLEQKTLRVKGDIAGTSATVALSSLDTLKKALVSHRIRPDEQQELKDIYTFDNRLIKGHLQRFNEPQKAALKVVDFDATFICPNPYWQDVNKTRVVQDVSTSPATWTVTNGGTVLTRPVITVSATGGNMTSVVLENLTSDQKVTFTGTVSTGNSWVLDTDSLTSENNGVSDLTNLSGDTDMILVPGDNEFKCTVTNGNECKIDFFQKYL